MQPIVRVSMITGKSAKLNVRREQLGLQSPGKHIDGSEQSPTVRDGIL